MIYLDYNATAPIRSESRAAMLLAMTGFVSTVAFCKFLLRGSIIE